MTTEQLNIEICKRVGAVDDSLEEAMSHISWAKNGEAICSLDKTMAEIQKLQICLRVQSNQPVQIKINGKSVEVTKAQLNYSDIVKLAYPEQKYDQYVIYTIIFQNATKVTRDFTSLQKTEGCLCPGDELVVQQGTKIDCVFTGNA